jgi:hypothetical protein
MLAAHSRCLLVGLPPPQPQLFIIIIQLLTEVKQLHFLYMFILPQIHSHRRCHRVTGSWSRSFMIVFCRQVLTILWSETERSKPRWRPGNRRLCQLRHTCQCGQFMNFKMTGKLGTYFSSGWHSALSINANRRSQTDKCNKLPWTGRYAIAKLHQGVVWSTGLSRTILFTVYNRYNVYILQCRQIVHVTGRKEFPFSKR